MEYSIVVGLTILATWSIIRIVTKSKYKKSYRTIYRQSDMHKMMKRFFTYELPQHQDTSSQLQKRREEGTIKVLVVEDQAYWVASNIFYVANVEDGAPVPETAKPVDTTNMSKKDVDKMLFILDNLRSGNKNDSGSTGNK
jgi:hypothetical protein